MATAVAAGYAAASTDTGHAGGNANFIVGHPEKLVDFEERAVHEMTGAAKAIADAFYGQRAATRVLQRLLHRRPPGADRSAALSGRLRRHHRGRAGQLRETPDVRADLALAGDAQGRREHAHAGVVPGAAQGGARVVRRPRRRQGRRHREPVALRVRSQGDALCRKADGRLPDGAPGRGGAKNLRGRARTRTRTRPSIPACSPEANSAGAARWPRNRSAMRRTSSSTSSSKTRSGSPRS